MRWSSGVHFRKLALGSRPLSIVPASALGSTRVGQTWFDDRMPQHAPIDLGAMISGIQRWVETESPTSSKAAVNRMIDMVQSDVADLPVTVERVPGRDGFADNLIVRNQAPGSGPGILIMSHIDTVHPIGTLAGPLPFRRDGDKLYGPGLFDMKGGAYLALEAFRQVARGEVREAAGHASCSRRTRRSAARPRAT